MAKLHVADLFSSFSGEGAEDVHVSLMCLGLINNGASHRVLVVKNWPANTGNIKKGGFDPWAGKIPWSRKWQPTPVFLP